MAIEPVSSAMTIQTQTAVKTQSAQTATTENKEVPVDGQTVNVDTTTASIATTQAEEKSKNNESDKDNGNKDSSNNAKQQQQNAIPQAVSDPLRKAIAEMNRKINNSNEEAVFGIHEETNRITIKILDKDTKEVLKEFPPEKTLDMIAKLWEVAGLLVDEKR